MGATAQELVDASARIYTDSTNWERYLDRDTVVLGHSKSADGSDIIALRGSKTVEDWLRDFKVYPQWDSDLGYCEAGFLEDMDELAKELYDIFFKLNMSNLAITGHSLGGARARILTAKLIKLNFPVCKLLTFGSPKPGFINLARIIQKSNIQHQSVRNRNDVVPTTPLSIEPFLDYVHTEDYILGDAAPEESNLEPLRDHSVSLYQQAVQTLTIQGVL